MSGSTNTPIQSKHDPDSYPAPLVIAPLSGTHKQTIIILHGRGSSAEKFGPELLTASIPGYKSLPAAFPGAKFIFPTASFRRATIYKRSWITQWFDNWSLSNPAEREELQIKGLQGSCNFVHEILRAEIDIVGAENVALGGLSQGCATSLVSLLLWDGPLLKATFGMCGWLPYRSRLEEIVSGREGEDDGDDIFESTSGRPVEDLGVEAVEWLRSELGTQGETARLRFREIPLFLGHGIEDDRVSVCLGREAASLLKLLGVDVVMKEYAGLGHWYSGNMLTDLVEFVRLRTGWT
jgi:predicted esterase